MANIGLTETLLGDGYEALTAQSLGIQQIVPVLEQLDQVGYHAVAVSGSKTFLHCLQELKEDPWQRLRRMRGEMSDTSLLLSIAGQSLLGERLLADDVVTYFIQRAVAAGIDIFRIYDPLNNILNVEQAIKIAKREGAQVQGTICYCVSPVHSSTYYLAFARQLKEEGVDSLCLLDEVGQLTPYAAYDLVRDIKSQTGLPVEIHRRDTDGLAGMVYLKAAEAGATGLDVSLFPFSGQFSLPSTQGMVRALAQTPYTTLLSGAAFSVLEDYLIEHKSPGDFLPALDFLPATVSQHQLSTTQVGELYRTLKDMGRVARLPAVLEEVGSLRGQAGQPALVSPVGDVFVAQALQNNLDDARFSQVEERFSDFVKGYYGRPPALVEVAFRQGIIGDQQPLMTRAADRLAPDLERLREELPKEYFTQPEDLLTFAFAPEVSLEFFALREKQQRASQAMEKE